MGWDNIFTSSNRRQDHHFTWSSEPREGINSSALQGKGSTFISQLLLRLWSGPGNRTRGLPLCSHARYCLSYSCCCQRRSLVFQTEFHMFGSITRFTLPSVRQCIHTREKPLQSFSTPVALRFWGPGLRSVKLDHFSGFRKNLLAYLLAEILFP